MKTIILATAATVFGLGKFSRVPFAAAKLYNGQDDER
jgi:hypothetical protein